MVDFSYKLPSAIPQNTVYTAPPPQQYETAPPRISTREHRTDPPLNQQRNHYIAAPNLPQRPSNKTWIVPWHESQGTIQGPTVKATYIPSSLGLPSPKREGNPSEGKTKHGNPGQTATPTGKTHQDNMAIRSQGR